MQAQYKVSWVIYTPEDDRWWEPLSHTHPPSRNQGFEQQNGLYLPAHKCDFRKFTLCDTLHLISEDTIVRTYS